MHLADPNLPKIIEIEALEIGYGGILKQIKNQKEFTVQYTSHHWTPAQQNYSTIKKFFWQLFYASPSFKVIY